jgi:D-aminopeptidase
LTAPDPRLATPAGKPRARSLGIPFAGEPGPWNAVTDVPGVEVGYVTLIEGDGVRTGVTAIHPLGRAHPGEPIPAGFHSQNGNGEMTGVSWIAESGTMNGPIAITNTHAVGVAHAGIVRWTVTRRPEVADLWLLPVATETYDGYLNDANGGHVTEEHVVAALDAARSGPVEAGSVGGGTGMNAYEFKGGSGTASRIVRHGPDRYTVGVFVQANFGSRSELVVAGVPVGAALADDNPLLEDDLATGFGVPWGAQVPGRPSRPPGAGSCIAIVITDAPLLPDQCRALARRVTIGLGRSGATGSHFSGDLFLAVSTAQPDAYTPGYTGLGRAGRGPYDSLRFVPWGDLDPFFTAVVEATDEAVLDSMIANEEMTGFRGHRSPALPRDRLVDLLREAGRIL